MKAIRDLDSENNLSAELDLGTELPLAYKHNGSRIGGTLTMLFGALFVAAPLGIIVLLVFFPDGSSTGGRITLRSEVSAYRVDVDWLTGQVRVHAGAVDEPGDQVLGEFRS